MAGFHTDVQALLQDINNNYGEVTDNEPSVPHPRSKSSAYYTHPCPGAAGHLSALSHDQQSPYATQNDKPPDTQLHHIPSSVGLDAYDRALLAEPTAQPLWQISDGINGAPARRLTLPGHTASAAPIDSWNHRRPRLQQPVPSPPDYRSQFAHYVHTPPPQVHGSSPSNDPSSSPSYRIKQRQISQMSRPFATRSSLSPSPRSVPAHKFASKMRKRSRPVSDVPELPQQPSLASYPPSPPNIQPHASSNSATPVVQGIPLVSLHDLPDRLRSVFHHPLFNAIQSKCFATAYKSNDNLVVSAPTGGGKTAILEMAICRLVSGYQMDQYKIVYMAPTKSLCSERQRDWQAKFSALDLRCAELTGDTEHGQLHNVQGASIVITTPEKWDSMTRKWKDHAKLMQMVKLFLIDEVHILKDTRGATLEAVVSRMKSVGSNVRFVALSATVPNSEDIATWLGKDASNQHLPAPQEKFGEEFRPVRLQKHVVGLPYRGNDFGFEGVCDPKLPNIIAKYSHKKPIMVFCITRNSTINTAKLLAKVWTEKAPRDRYWEGPTQRIIVQDPELNITLTSGVAFHHAGLDSRDRHAVENGFLNGQVSVICCTSTLAVGVNLPCHMVIIKNTVSFSDEGLKEYADLEVMQMLGRAGRPQFDTTAVAVIITKQDKVSKYEKLVSGNQVLESCLHLNLIDHLNAEIGLGTIHDVYTAKRWLAGTFLYVRLRQNPDHYKLDGDGTNQNLDDRIERICRRDLALLQESTLIDHCEGRLKSTELGDAMARYYVQFRTMQVLLQLGPRAKMSDILSALVQANEFQEIRLKAPEKKLFKELNQRSGIKYPIKVDLAQSAHKRSLIVQAELGGVEFPADEQFAKLKRQFQIDKTILFSHLHRLVKCVIDCQIHLKDAVAARHALELGRSFSARVWDNSPYQMKQISQIGLVAIRKFATGGINSIEALEAAEPHRIEMLLSKNPPFGQQLLDKLKDFPKLRVSVKMMGKDVKPGRPITVKVKAECDFMNEKVPMTFSKRPLYVCLLTERSDGQLIDFRRMSAKNLNNGQDVHLSAEILNHTQYLTCHVMCEAVAGTLRYAELKPELPAQLFPQSPTPTEQQQTTQHQRISSAVDFGQADGAYQTSPATLEDNEFAEDEIDDQDLVNVATGLEFNHIDHLSTHLNRPKTSAQTQSRNRTSAAQPGWNPERLDNGKWACNHKCKDKTLCKHMCCREGIDKAPKPPRTASVSASLADTSAKATTNGMRQLPLPTVKANRLRTLRQGHTAHIETINLTDQSKDVEAIEKMPKRYQDLQRLHDKVMNTSNAPVVSSKKNLSDPSCGNRQLKLSDRLNHETKSSDKLSPEYSDDWMDDLPSPSAMMVQDVDRFELTAQNNSTSAYSSNRDEPLSPCDLPPKTDAEKRQDLDSSYLREVDFSPFDNEDDRSDIEAAMVGLSDSVATKEEWRAQAASNDMRQSKSKDRSQEMTLREELRMEALDPSSKLFLSTDGPEKYTEPQPKRKASLVPETEEIFSIEPAVKRSKMEDASGPVPRSTSGTEQQASIARPVIKPGQPAWVYEMDPEFIAEYQDFVDFI